jgi:hypothetical protein
MTPPDTPRWSHEEMIRLAASGVARVDLLGPRGTTLCSMDEIAAMAAFCAMAGEIGTHVCRKWRGRAGHFENVNAQYVTMYRACNRCHVHKGEDDGLA